VADVAARSSVWLAWIRLWHDTLATLILLIVGVLLLVAGAFLPRAQAVEIALLVIGSGVLLVGAFLARVQGTIKIGPTGFELGVGPLPAADSLLKLEATRERAAEVAPSEEDVDQAVGRAYRDLFPEPATVAVSLAGSASGFTGSNLLASRWSRAGLPLGSPARFPAVTRPPSHEDYATVLRTLSEPTDAFAERVLDEVSSKWPGANENVGADAPEDDGRRPNE
jgi:hypothetical protein